MLRQRVTPPSWPVNLSGLISMSSNLAQKHSQQDLGEKMFKEIHLGRLRTKGLSYYMKHNSGAHNTLQTSPHGGKVPTKPTLLSTLSAPQMFSRAMVLNRLDELSHRRDLKVGCQPCQVLALIRHAFHQLRHRAILREEYCRVRDSLECRIQGTGLKVYSGCCH